MELTKTDKITGLSLLILLGFAVISSSFYFLHVLKISALEWMIYNACAPSSILHIIGISLWVLKKKNTFLLIGVVPMYFFGTMGIFNFSWEGNNLFAQLSHVVMTLNLLYVIYLAVKVSDYKEFFKSLLISVICFIPYISYVQYYCRTHAEDVMRVLQMT
ncbi:hypothetical protein ACSBL2_11690 [Pedobacter sp. AW31-3R]|uniref:hypothetical protein n=1 Tax=Pedobacter sp. AW31-3R TaxID=3445781 RepID=UPI003FA0B84B